MKMTFALIQLSFFALLSTQANAQVPTYPFTSAMADVKALVGNGYVGKDLDGKDCTVSFTHTAAAGVNSETFSVNVTQDGKAYNKSLYDLNDASNSGTLIQNHQVFRIAEKTSKVSLVAFSNYNDVENSGLQIEQAAHNLRIYFTASGGKGPWNDFIVSCQVAR